MYMVVCLFVYIYVNMYVYIYIYVYIYKQTYKHILYVYIYKHTCIYIDILYSYICTYVCVCIYTHTVYYWETFSDIRALVSFLKEALKKLICLNETGTTLHGTPHFSWQKNPWWIHFGQYEFSTVWPRR